MGKNYKQSESSLAWITNRAMVRDNKPISKFLSDKTHYWTAESLPFAYAMACVQIVLLHGKADIPYNEAVKAWELPDCQSVAQGIVINYFDIKQMVRGWPGIFSNLENGPDKYAESKDFLHLINSLCEFIKVGFNREIDQANEAWKVLPDADSPLFKAVIVWTLADHLGIKLEEWNQYRPLVREGKVYDTEDIMVNKPTNRIHREVVSVFKIYGKLTSDKRLLKDADQWYKCRVNPGSIEAYLQELADLDLKGQEPSYPDQGRVSNNIAACDEATGYPRHK